MTRFRKISIKSRGEEEIVSTVPTVARQGRAKAEAKLRQGNSRQFKARQKRRGNCQADCQVDLIQSKQILDTHIEERDDVGNLDEAVQVADHILHSPRVLRLVRVTPALSQITKTQQKQEERKQKTQNKKAVHRIIRR